MAAIVRFLTNDDGEAEVTDDEGNAVWGDKWHLINDFGDAPRTLCSGEAFGFGESNAEFETKGGKVTCKRCLEMIRFFKKVRI